MVYTNTKKRAAHPQKPHREISHEIDRDHPTEEVVKFVPLGGLEEIGRNMSMFEYGNEIVIFDMGLQFPEEDTPGIDYIIPNIQSLIPKKKNIKAIVITHGHYDHLGAIPYIMEKLGPSIPIYTAALTREIIKKRQDDFPHTSKLFIQVVKGGEKVRLSEHIEAEFFETEHTIPDSISTILKTPVGNFAYLSDIKIDYDMEGTPHRLEAFEEMNRQKIHTLFLESTRAEAPGKSLSEKIVEKNLDELIGKAGGRIIIGLFASLLTRIAPILQIAEKHGRKVFLSGLSLKTNVNIAQSLGYLKIPKGLIVPLEEIHKYKDDKVLVLSTGAQGEPKASMVKIANGENKHISIKKGDTIIFSASVIPGNERPVQTLKDNLTRQGARVIQTQHIDVHASGHGPSEDLKMIIGIIKPKYFIPIHGMYFMRAANVENAKEMGIAAENCFLVDNGQIVDIYADKIKVSQDSVPAYYVMVDGLGVGDVEEVVVRDRMLLAQEGMMVVIVTLDRRTGRFIKNPDIISRGFIYLKENKEVVEEVRKKIKGLIGRIPRFQSLESDYLKGLLRDQIGQFVYNKTNRRPMILPVVIEV
jgi:ribonuclease J